MSRSTRFAPLLALLIVAALPFADVVLRGEIFTFRDHQNYFIPLRYFTAEVLRSGEIPLWNPFNGLGERWLANPQTGVFYPPAWMFVILPFPLAYASFLWLHVGLLGCGGFLLFRRWSSARASSLGAVVLMLGGPTMSLLDVSNNLATLAWLPLVLWCAAERGRPDPRIPRSFAALVLGMMFLAAEPVLAFLGGILYLVFYLALAERRRFADPLLVGGMSLALVGAQLVPFLEWLRGSDRAAGLLADRALVHSMRPSDWLAILISLAAEGSQLELLETGQKYLASMYLGIVPAALAACGLTLLVAQRDRVTRRVAQLWSLLLAFAMILSAGSHVVSAQTWSALHLDLNRYPARVVPIGVLAIVGLCVIGFERVSAVPDWQRALLFGLLCLGTATALLTFQPAGGLSLELRAWIAVIALIVTGIVLFRPNALQTATGALLLTAVIGADLFFAARPLLASGPFVDRVPPYDSLFGARRYFARHGTDGPHSRQSLDGYANLLDRKLNVATPAPVIPVRYRRLMQILDSGQQEDLLGFMAIGYLLSPRELNIPWLQLLTRSGGMFVYRHVHASALLTAWPAYTPAASDDEAFRKFIDPKKDARAEIFITAPPDSLGETLRTQAVLGGAPGGSIERMTTSSVSARIATPRGIVLSLTQLMAPGWKVEVDGMPAPSLTINGLFRGTVVPAGEHLVQWTYEPLSLRIGVLITLAGLCLTVIDLVVFARTRRVTKRSLSTRISSPETGAARLRVAGEI